MAPLESVWKTCRRASAPGYHHPGRRVRNIVCPLRRTDRRGRNLADQTDCPWCGPRKGHGAHVPGGVLKPVPPGDLVTTTGQSEVTVQPGKVTRLTVKIERRNGFTGRVPLDVRGLPHGVRVLDIGLNGILVLPGETTRTIEIYCEPWMKPTEQPFVVFARREGKNTMHAAKSVLLRVTGRP